MLERKAEKLFSNMEDLIDLAIKSQIDLDSMVNMGEEDMAALKLVYETMNGAKEFYIELGRKLDKIEELDKKIDRLLAMKDKES